MNKPLAENPPVSKLSDVARRAGVGNATVSRALNGGKNVSADAMERINIAIRELDYTPNRIARSLKGASSGMIGMIVPSISDTFFSHCAEAVEEVAREYGALLVVLASGDESEVISAGVRQLLLHNIDGLIIASSQRKTPSLTKQLAGLRVPVVGIDGPLTSAGLQSVLCENFKGAGMATQHLLDHGYESIISVQVKPTLYTMRQRFAGYCATLKHRGLPAVEEIITDRESAARMMRRHLKRLKSIAIFSGNNLTARYLYEASHQMGLSIPDQVAMVSFDDFELADTLTPPLSVVQQPVNEIGKAAARLLFNRQPGDRLPGRSRRNLETMLAPHLILRNSCGCSTEETGLLSPST